MGLFDALFGGSKQSSSSTSTSSSQTFVDPGQQPYLDLVRNLGSGLALSQLPGITNTAFGLGNQFLGQGQNLAQGIFQGAYGLNNLSQNPGAQRLNDLSRQWVPSAFTEPLQQFARFSNVGGQVNQLGSDLGRFFNQQLLPGIRGEANMMGQLGGSRQGVAEGFAAQSMLDAFQRGSTDLYAGAQNRAATAASQLANIGLGQQGLQTDAASRYLGQIGTGYLGGGQLSLGGIGGLASLMNLGLSPYAAQMSPLAMLSSLIGSPTVLGQSQSTSTSRGGGSQTNGILGGLGFNFLI